MSAKLKQAPYSGGALLSSPVVPAGSGTETYKPSGVIEVNTTTYQTTAVTTEEDFWSYSLPADTLSANGQLIRVKATGSFAANANNKRVRAYFGGTVVYDSSSVAANGLLWEIEFDVIRTGASAEFYSAKGFARAAGATIVGATAGNMAQGTAAVATSGAITVKITGTNGTAVAADIVMNSVVMEYLP